MWFNISFLFQISLPIKNDIIQTYENPCYKQLVSANYIFDSNLGDQYSLADMVKRCNAVGVR